MPSSRPTRLPAKACRRSRGGGSASARGSSRRNKQNQQGIASIRFHNAKAVATLRRRMSVPRIDHSIARMTHGGVIARDDNATRPRHERVDDPREYRFLERAALTWAHLTMLFAGSSVKEVQRATA